MIVEFTDRAGVHGSHQSNVIRKSSKHVGQDIDAISGRMRGSMPCNGRVCLATPPDPSTRQVMGTCHPREGSLPHDLLAKTLHETTEEKLEEVEGRSRQEVEWIPERLNQVIGTKFPKRRSSIDAIFNWRGGARDNGNQVIVEFPKAERRNSTGNAKERGGVRGNLTKEMLSQSTMSIDQKHPIGSKENPIKELLSLSVMSLDRKSRADKGDPINEGLSQSAMSLDRGLKKQSKHRLPIQHPQDPPRHDASDWSQSSIDWGCDKAYWKYELNFYADQKDPICTRRQNLQESFEGWYMSVINGSAHS
jgi:hypothetical protein